MFTINIFYFQHVRGIKTKPVMHKYVFYHLTISLKHQFSSMSQVKRYVRFTLPNFNIQSQPHMSNRNQLK